MRAPPDMLAFGALPLAAILLRQRSDWHKRLVLCGTIAMMEPAFGRILPMPLLGPWAGACATLMQLLYVGIAMRADAGLRGAVHPAYRWQLWRASRNARDACVAVTCEAGARLECLRASSGTFPNQSLQLAGAGVAGVIDSVAPRPDAVD